MPVRAKYLAARHALKDPFHRAIGARIAIMHGVAKQFAGAIEQGIIDAPAIQADGRSVQPPHLCPA